MKIEWHPWKSLKQVQAFIRAFGFEDFSRPTEQSQPGLSEGNRRFKDFWAWECAKIPRPKALNHGEHHETRSMWDQVSMECLACTCMHNDETINISEALSDVPLFGIVMAHVGHVEILHHTGLCMPMHAWDKLCCTMLQIASLLSTIWAFNAAAPWTCSRIIWWKRCRQSRSKQSEQTSIDILRWQTAKYLRQSVTILYLQFDATRKQDEESTLLYRCTTWAHAQSVSSFLPFGYLWTSGNGQPPMWENGNHIFQGL